MLDLELEQEQHMEQQQQQQQQQRQVKDQPRHIVIAAQRLARFRAR
jgi:hypothetical protein